MPIVLLLAVRLNELLDAVITSSIILGTFFKLCIFCAALDNSRKRCSDLVSIGAVVRISSFGRVWLNGRNLNLLFTRKNQNSRSSQIENDV